MTEDREPVPPEALITVDWTKLPQPQDDGAAKHLLGATLPALALPASDGGQVDLSTLPGRSVLFVYPMTGQPGRALPEDWDSIPGARGCTPQACSFRDLASAFAELGVARLFGLSTQDSAWQREAAARLNLPFPLLSDAQMRLADQLSLPRFDTGGVTYLKRLSLMLRDGQIEAVFYPVFPPDRSAEDVLDWLKGHPLS